MFESVNGQHSTRWYWQSLCLFYLCVCSSIGCLISGCLTLHSSHLLLFKILLFTLHLFWFSFDRHPWKVWRHSTQSLERNWVWRPLCSPNGSFYLFWVRLRSGKEHFAIISLNYDIDIQCLCCKLLLVCVGVLCAPLMERAVVKQWLWDNERGLINVLTLQRGHLQGMHMRFEF